MVQTVYPGRVDGTVTIPGSKSHTIRALLIAALADGKSELYSPLYSKDTYACIDACRALGAEVTPEEERILVTGVAGAPTAPKAPTPPAAPTAPAARTAPKAPTPPAADTATTASTARAEPIDVANSGTTLFLATTIAALCDRKVCFDGDPSIRRRSAAPLLAALADLGVTVEEQGAPGCAPYCVTGPIGGGSTSISCRTSQYLSSLLIGLPLANGDTEIEVPLLYERPYVEMTLSWLDSQEISYERNGFERFRIPGRQHYRAFSRQIPGDFSSGTFFFVLAAITGSRLAVRGLDLGDPQGDKQVLSVLETMGCSVERGEQEIVVTGPRPRRNGGPGLSGGSFDLNSMPDALPALAVAAACASSPVRLVNVAHAREKETDRIAVMAEELSKMGAQVRELPDGLEVQPSLLRGAEVDAHDDHRVAMSLALAAIAAEGDNPTKIAGAESADVTFPGFFELLESVRTR